MKREDYYRIDNKLDKHTEMLIGIKDDINKDISFLKLAHQRLKYATIGIGVTVLVTLTIEYPKLVKFIKHLL